MKFAPKHNDKTLRILYVALFIVGGFFMTMQPQDNTRRTAYICVSLITIATALYLLMRYEMTTYTYVLNPNENNYDFFVDKSVGKRGAYVCSYRVSDIVEIIPYQNDSKEKLKARDSEIGFFDYTHNLFKKEKKIIIFKYQSKSDAIVVELSPEFESFLVDKIELVRQANRDELANEIEEELLSKHLDTTNESEEAIETSVFQTEENNEK